MRARVISFLLLAGWGQSSGARAQSICVDPGHGGSDPGAVGCGLDEKDVNLDTGLRLRDLLQGAGFSVLMTRETDVFISLVGRADYANANGADRFVSIHANSNSGTPATGTETYCATGAGANAVDLRDRVQAEMVAAWGLADRGGKTANFTVLTATAMPATLSELGFVNNCAVDAVYLSSPEHRQEAAAAHLRAIQLHYGHNPTDTGTARGAVFEDQGVGTDDMSIRLTGALVTVEETGDQATAEGADALWAFTLEPGTYTLRAALAGYESASRGCQVAANATAWCSIGLIPETTGPDGGTQDGATGDGGTDGGADTGTDTGGPDAGEEPDAGGADATPDGADARDAGTDDDRPELEPQKKGCGCTGPGQGAGWPCVLLPVVLLIARPGRRRLLLALLVTGTLLAGALAAPGARAAEPVLQDTRLLLPGDFSTAVLSPDGARLLLGGPGLDTLYLLELRQPQALPRLLARGARAGFAPRWSDDGRRVAVRDPRRPFAAAPVWVDLQGEQLGRSYPNWFVWAEQADDEIWLESPVGRRRIDPGGDRYFAPRFSPGGRYLVFEGLASGLHLVRLADGRLFRLGDGHHPDFGGERDELLVYDRSTDDGHRITSGELVLCRLERAGPQCASLTKDSPAIEQHPSLSADGRKLVFIEPGVGVRIGDLVPGD